MADKLRLDRQFRDPPSKPLIRKLADWHLATATSFPWRVAPHGFRDPYHVWIVEVMAQQTRVSTIVPYFNRWVEALPSPTAVANAHEDQILKLWEGLGYYRRALNLHRAAKLMVERHGGRVPGTKEELLALPGIGRYTAGGILSLAFNQPEPAVDGNVVRLYSRLHNAGYSAQRKADVDAIDLSIRELLRTDPTVSPGLVAEGLMALGSKVCRPRRPDCGVCPMQANCATFASPETAQQPNPTKKAPTIRTHIGFVLLANRDQETLVFLVRNKRHRLLGGLWGFPAVTCDELPVNDLKKATRIAEELFGATVEHVKFLATDRQEYSHFQRIQDTFEATCSLAKLEIPHWEEGNWVPIDAVNQLALSRIDQKIAKRLCQTEVVECRLPRV